MGSYDLEISLYNEDFKQLLKWYSWIKDPTKKDQGLYAKIQILLEQLERLDKEEKEEDE